MKKIVNTARIDFCIDGRCSSMISNKSCVQVMLPCDLLQGDVFCRKGCCRWSVSVVQRISGERVFFMDGTSSKGFCFAPDPCSEYALYFRGGDTSVLRLYNTPDCVTKTCFE